MASTSVSKPKKAQASAEDSSAFGPIAERFRRAGDLERAVSLCRDGLQKFPHHISARVTLGWALLELGKYDEAQVELEQVLRRRPDNLAAIRALAELHDRSEQTLNLPMDGPGQWPPTEDAVDEAATGAVAGSFGSISADMDEASVAFDAAQPDPAATYQPAPAVAAPPELGPAMWSALPPPEAVASVHAQLVQVDSIGVSEADIAALLAEAESLEAAAQLPTSPAVEAAAVDDVQLGQAAEVQLDSADIQLDAVVGQLDQQVPLDASPDVQLDAGADVPLETLAVAQFAEAAVEIEPAAVVLEAGSDLSMFEDAAYHTPEHFGVSVPAEAVFEVQVPIEPEPASEVDAAPGFQLEAVSIMAVEAESGLLAEMESGSLVEGEGAFDLDAHPFLDFDAEPVFEAEAVLLTQPEPLPEPQPEPQVQLEAQLQPEPQVQPEIVVSESVLEPAAMATIDVDPVAMVHVQPEQAPESVSLAQTVEPQAVRSPIAALEGFLARVQSRRRQVMTESVA